MGILRRLKKESKADSGNVDISERNSEIIEKTEAGTISKELDYARKELQETVSTLDTTAHKLEHLKDEYAIKSNELEKIMKELEVKKTEIN